MNFIEMHRMRMKNIINILQAVESKLLGTLRSTTVLLVHQAVLIESQKFKATNTVSEQMPQVKHTTSAFETSRHS
jgi:hypothetical protein